MNIKHNFSSELSSKHYLDKDLFTIVVPVLNEEEGIGKVLSNIKEEGYNNVLVVDGHSTDDTCNVVHKNNVEYIFQNGVGKTGAIETAINHIDTLFFMVMDGDCTYHPRDIKNFYPALLKNDQVIGSRVLGTNNIPLLHRFGNWVINSTFNTLFKTNIIDVCSGMYALRTQFAKTLNFQTQGFDVEVEIAAQAARRGSIGQVPINYYPRVGKNKLRPFEDGVQIFKSIIKLSIRTRTNN